jgi:hypothetical protein
MNLDTMLRIECTSKTSDARILAGPRRRVGLCAAIVLAMVAQATPAVAQANTAEHVEWFQKTEQALMDAIAAGDKAPWDAIMDDNCIVTTEEGKLTPKAEFLSDLRPLPQGLAGSISVRQLTVHEFPAFAIVRFLADEQETVFSQRLAVRYRVTDTYRQTGSTWKMVASHVAVVTSDPPPQKVATDGWPGLVGT